jgi:DNA-binding transcriptional ArsR family regulator
VPDNLCHPLQDSVASMGGRTSIYLRIPEPKYGAYLRAGSTERIDLNRHKQEMDRMNRSVRPPVRRAKLLSKELLVAREIYEATIVEKRKPVYFNQLVERMKERKLASRATISFALDMLFDQGIVRADWTRTEDGKHVRGLTIAGEAEQFVRAIYEATR